MSKLTPRITQLIKILEYYIFCGGDKVKYLRKQGLIIGENCILDNSVFDFGSEPWLINLGDDISITRGVLFITHDGASRIYRKTVDWANPYFGNTFGRITIMSNCFIGMNSIILPNICIGPNSIVGCGSVVTKDVEPNSVYAGNPAKKIRSLDEYIENRRIDSLPIFSKDRISLKKELTKLL